MAIQEIINTGALPNDGEGDPLRTAFTKINNNFTELFSTGTITSEMYTSGNTANQPIFQTPVITFTQATFQINSSNPLTDDSQNITINATLTNNKDNVRFTGHGSLFNGIPIGTYNMDIANSNVRVLFSPFVSTGLDHFIASEITWVGPELPGLDFQLDGYPDDNLLITENDFFLTTTTEI